MQLRRETNLYDDQAIAKLNQKVESTYGTCSTAAATATKVVALENFKLFKGAQITVYFTNANTAANPTLNVNGTGAKAIWARGAAISSTFYWSAKSTHHFTYDGTHWVMENAESVEETYKRLTNDEELKGIFMDNGKLYINMDYLSTGRLKLGGTSNSNGTMEVFNSSGTRVGRWDNEALYIGNIASSLTNPNTKIESSGAITTKSLTANDYIYVDGNAQSFFKIPFSNTAADGYLEISSRFFLKYFRSTLETKQFVYFNAEGLPSNTPVCALTAQYNDNVYSAVDPYQIRVVNSSKYTYLRGGYADIQSGGSRYVSINPANSNVAIMGYGVTVSGTKSRYVETTDYGSRFLYCYETPTPLFGDVGEGVISEDGKCYVQIDSMFSETVTLNQYQVFLQKYGDGECWVSERKGSYFVVEGTPNLHFGWEIKAKQSDFDQYRLEKDVGSFETENNIDYAIELTEHINEIAREREVA